MLKSVVESLEDVPEALHEDYEQADDGKYVLRKDVFEDHPGWRKLKGTLNTLDRDKRKAAEKASRYDALAGLLPDGLDLSEVDEDVREKAFQLMRGELSIEGSGAPDPDQIERIKQGARQPLEKKLSQAQQQAEEYKGLFLRTVRDQALTEAMAEAKIADPYRPAVQAMFRDRAKVEVGDDVTVMIDGEYGPQDLKSYLKEWVQTEQGQYFVQAPINNGGGARGGQASAKVKNPWSKEHWNMTEQARIYREDRERARKMAAEQGKRVA